MRRISHIRPSTVIYHSSRKTRITRAVNRAGAASRRGSGLYTAQHFTRRVGYSWSSSSCSCRPRCLASKTRASSKCSLFSLPSLHRCSNGREQGAFSNLLYSSQACIHLLFNTLSTSCTSDLFWKRGGSKGRAQSS